MKINAGSARKADLAFLPRKNCGWQCVAVPMKACRWCGRTSLAAVVRAGNNLSLMPTGARRGTSKVSLEVSDSFAGSASVKALRARLEKQGILVDGKLTQDYLFSSQSGAGQFLNGTSFDGNSNWKMADGTPLKQVLE